MDCVGSTLDALEDVAASASRGMGGQEGFVFGLLVHIPSGRLLESGPRSVRGMSNVHCRLLSPSVTTKAMRPGPCDKSPSLLRN